MLQLADGTRKAIDLIVLDPSLLTNVSPRFVRRPVETVGVAVCQAQQAPASRYGARRCDFAWCLRQYTLPP